MLTRIWTWLKQLFSPKVIADVEQVAKDGEAIVKDGEQLIEDAAPSSAALSEDTLKRIWLSEGKTPNDKMVQLLTKIHGLLERSLGEKE